jgi:hypothetical protein
MVTGVLAPKVDCDGCGRLPALGPRPLSAWLRANAAVVWPKSDPGAFGRQAEAPPSAPEVSHRALNLH